ncbi:hypothetical protein GCM10009737_04150 [Nocardioides lentus]|uniref:Asp23/Gls24 family envelope stress response protein n=1 Tax=Nocardioides lentus TaxID=338077 RepID=A0ABN2NYU6_9ACTN
MVAVAESDLAPRHAAPAADGSTGSEDGFALSDVSGAADRPPEERGRLDLKTRALAHLAEHAASEVPGTVRSGSAVRRSLGRAYPHASASLDAGRASLDLDVAVAWPAPVADVARRTRDHVLERARTLSGIDVRRVDVTVHVVSASEVEETTESRRVL